MAGAADITVTTVLAILVIANIFGNSLVCVIFMKNNELRYVNTEMLV